MNTCITTTAEHCIICITVIVLNAHRQEQNCDYLITITIMHLCVSRWQLLCQTYCCIAPNIVVLGLHDCGICLSIFCRFHLTLLYLIVGNLIFLVSAHMGDFGFFVLFQYCLCQKFCIGTKLQCCIQDVA